MTSPDGESPTANRSNERIFHGGGDVIPSPQANANYGSCDDEDSHNESLDLSLSLRPLVTTSNQSVPPPLAAPFLSPSPKTLSLFPANILPSSEDPPVPTNYDNNNTPAPSPLAATFLPPLPQTLSLFAASIFPSLDDPLVPAAISTATTSSVTFLIPARRRLSRKQAWNEFRGKTDTVPAPFHWATTRRALHATPPLHGHQ